MATNWFGGSMSDYVDVLSNIAASMGPVQKLLSGAAYLIGLAFAFKAIYALKLTAESGKMGMGGGGSGGLKEPIVYLVVAVMLIYLPTGFDVLMNSTFGTNNIVSYQAADDIFGLSGAAGSSLTLIIRTIGLISFVRGWVLIAKSASHGQPPGGTGKGLIHVFGGILAMNIVGTMQIVNNTLYGSS